MSCRTRTKTAVAAFIAGATLVVAGFLLGYVVFPNAIRLRIMQSVQLNRGSDALQRYIKTPVPVQIKVYVFNVTNTEEVHTGRAPPQLQEMGPYVYDLYKEKVELEEDFDTDTLSYFIKNKYFFNRELSVGDEDDQVTVLNAPLLAMVEKTKSSAAMQTFLNSALPDLYLSSREKWGPLRRTAQLTAFVRTTVGGLMFRGVPIKCSRRGIFRGFMLSLICAGIASSRPPSIRSSDGYDGFENGDFLFSFLHSKNDTKQGPLLVHRGLTDISKMGQVLAWQDQSMLKVWGPPAEESHCNQVEGQDSSVIPPFLNESSVITAFQPELCRSLSAYFEKPLEYGGIPALRFVADHNMFETASRYPHNWCYYPTGDDKQRDRYWATTEYGTQDISECAGGPMIVSFPHFYRGSESFLEYARGLRPTKEDHETFLDIEKMTGTPMRAAKRLQLNMPLKRNSRIAALKDVSEGLFPVIWMEEGMSLEPKFTKLIKEGLFDVMDLLFIIQWGTISLGVMVMIIALAVSRGRWGGRSGDAEDNKMKEANKLPTYEMSVEDSSTDRYG